MSKRTANIRYKIKRFRDGGSELLIADLAARAALRFPRIAYWAAMGVGARNIADDEIAFDVPYMDVLNRQFMKTKAFK